MMFPEAVERHLDDQAALRRSAEQGGRAQQIMEDPLVANYFKSIIMSALEALLTRPYAECQTIFEQAKAANALWSDLGNALKQGQVAQIRNATTPEE